MKAIENFRFGYDDLLILPRVWSEMRPDCYRPGARGETNRQATVRPLKWSGGKMRDDGILSPCDMQEGRIAREGPRSAVLVRAGHPAVGKVGKPWRRGFSKMLG